MKDIKMNVKKIRKISEVNEGGSVWVDRVIYFEALTPLSETDTCTMIARYFNGGLDFNTSINITPSLSNMSGSFKISTENNQNPVRQLEYTIPVAEELIRIIEKKEYQYENECVEQFVLAWVGDFRFICES